LEEDGEVGLLPEQFLLLPLAGSVPISPELVGQLDEFVQLGRLIQQVCFGKFGIGVLVGDAHHQLVVEGDAGDGAGHVRKRVLAADQLQFIGVLLNGTGIAVESSHHLHKNLYQSFENVEERVAGLSLFAQQVQQHHLSYSH
jgi:hypothetical protein